MQEQLPRKLAAIFYADVAEYSRLTDEDEEDTHVKLAESLDFVRDRIKLHHGSIDHYAGDAVLADFTTVTDALECALSIQDDLALRNRDRPEQRRVQFRIGINLGEVIVDRDEIFGNDVNIANRLESLAEAGGICVSDTVRRSIGNKLPVEFEFLGKQLVKNIREPVLAYRVRSRATAFEAAPLRRKAFDLPEEPSIAVLPFANLSVDPEQEYFADGITEDIITALSRLPGLFVVARHSTFVYKRQAVDIRQVGREQGVRFVLEGSVRRSGNRIRITAQLVDARSGAHRWAERYDRDLGDIFDVQDEITREVTIAVQVEISAGEQARLWAGGSDNLEAWECVVRGNACLHRNSPEGNQEARHLATLALEHDPDYANAWVLLGFTHYVDALWNWSTSIDVTLRAAQDAALKAMDLEEFNPDALSLLACVKTQLGEFQEAVEIGHRAVAMTPKHSPNVAVYAITLLHAHRYREAIDEIKRAIRLSPFYPAWYMHVLGSCSFAVGDYAQSARAYEACVKATAIESAFLPVVRVWRAIALAAAGQTDEARRAHDEVMRIYPDFSIDAWRQFRRIDPAVEERAVEIWNRLATAGE